MSAVGTPDPVAIEKKTREQLDDAFRLITVMRDSETKLSSRVLFLSQTKDTLEQEKESLRRDLELLRSDILATKSQLKESHHQNSILSQRAEDSIAQTSKQTADWKDQCDLLRGDIFLKAEQLRLAEVAREEACVQLAAAVEAAKQREMLLEAEKDDLREAFKRDLDVLEAQHRNALAEKQTLVHEAEEREAAARESFMKQSELSTFQSHELDRVRSDADAEVARLQVIAEDAKRESASASLKLSLLEQTVDTLKKELLKYQTSSDNANALLAHETEQRIHLQSSLARVNGELELVRQQYLDTQRMLSDGTPMKLQQVENEKELMAVKRQMSAMVSDKTAEIIQLRFESERWQTRASTFEQQLAGAQNRALELEAINSQLKQQLDRALRTHTPAAILEMLKEQSLDRSCHSISTHEQQLTPSEPKVSPRQHRRSASPSSNARSSSPPRSSRPGSHSSHPAPESPTAEAFAWTPQHTHTPSRSPPRSPHNDGHVRAVPDQFEQTTCGTTATHSIPADTHNGSSSSIPRSPISMSELEPSSTPLQSMDSPLVEASSSVAPVNQSHSELSTSIFNLEAAEHKARTLFGAEALDPPASSQSAQSTPRSHRVVLPASEALRAASMWEAALTKPASRNMNAQAKHFRQLEEARQHPSPPKAISFAQAQRQRRQTPSPLYVLDIVPEASSKIRSPRSVSIGKGPGHNVPW